MDKTYSEKAFIKLLNININTLQIEVRSLATATTTTLMKRINEILHE